MKRLDFDKRLAELGIALPVPPAPYSSYVPTIISGNYLYVSGQLSSRNGERHHQGKLGGGVTLKTTKEAARMCGLNILAHVRNACGGTLNRVTQCVRMNGYVSASPECEEHAKAMDACSDLMRDVFGEVGRHTRTSVGVVSLPLSALIAVDAIFEIDSVKG